MLDRVRITHMSYYIVGIKIVYKTDNVKRRPMDVWDALKCEVPGNFHLL